MDFNKLGYHEVGDILTCRFQKLEKGLLSFEFTFHNNSPVKIVFHEMKYSQV